MAPFFRKHKKSGSTSNSQKDSESSNHAFNQDVQTPQRRATGESESSLKTDLSSPATPINPFLKKNQNQNQNHQRPPQAPSYQHGISTPPTQYSNFASPNSYPSVATPSVNTPPTSAQHGNLPRSAGNYNNGSYSDLSPRYSQGQQLHNPQIQQHQQHQPVPQDAPQKIGNYRYPPPVSPSTSSPSNAANRGLHHPSGKPLPTVSYNTMIARTLEPPTPTPWTKKFLYNSPFPRFMHTASSFLTENGSFFVMGGLRDANVYGDIWILQPTNAKNSSNEDSGPTNYCYLAKPIENFEGIPAPRVGHSSVLIGNAYIVFGGDTLQTNEIGELDNNLYFFHVGAYKWTIPNPTGEKPTGRYGHSISIITLSSDPENIQETTPYLYLFGGMLDNDIHNDMWSFDLSNFRRTQWNKVLPSKDSPVPPRLTNHTMSIFDERIYIYGGFDGVKLSNKLWSFDPTEKIWENIELKGYQPPALREHAAATFNNLLFIYGGKDKNDNPSDVFFCINLEKFICFRIKNDVFSSPGKRMGHSLTVDLAQEKLIIVGGDPDDSDLTDAYVQKDYVLEGANLAYDKTVLHEFDINKLPNFIVQEDLELAAKPKEQEMFKEETPKKEKEIDEFSSLNENEFTSSTPLTTPNKQEISSPTHKEESPSNSPELLTFSNHEEMEVSPTKPLVNPAEHNVSSETEESVVKGATLNASSARTVNGVQSESSFLRHYANATDNGEVDNEKEADHTEIEAKSVPKSEYDELVQLVDQLRFTLDSKVKEANDQVISLEEKKNKEIEGLKIQLADVKSQIQTPTIPVSSPSDAIIAGSLSNKSIGTRAIQEGTETAEAAEDQTVIEETIETKEGAIDDKSIDTAEVTTVGLKRQVLSLQNKLVHLEQEKDERDSQLTKFKPLLDNQIVELTGLNSLIKTQESKILELEDYVKDQTSLQKEVLQWKSKYEEIQLELEESKKLAFVDGSINGEDTINGEEGDESKEPVGIHKSVHKITQGIDNLISVWSGLSTETGPIDKSVDVNEEDLPTRLQKQIDQLLELNATQEEEKHAFEEELDSLKNELREVSKEKEALETKSVTNKDLETNYKQSVQSLKNTHKALNLSQLELEKQKDLNKKLSSEIEELRLFKLNKRNTSRNVTPVIVNDSESFQNDTNDSKEPRNEDPDDDDDNNELNDHYDLKIKDLEADLFILKQERDQLKDEVHQLKKTLYTK
ncbi:BA75_00316T0 [Komagataella pastoris]|uniref:BA75_00316T0 n=1 Tax=Komagataella pastoris TaxID=4922 RepID=A0A1B2J7V0_PICPA|nr:BA75_00316T0 [Komagataella pastoris]